MTLLFALVLHLNGTALSQSESSNFFKYVIILKSIRIALFINLPRKSVAHQHLKFIIHLELFVAYGDCDHSTGGIQNRTVLPK